MVWSPPTALLDGEYEHHIRVAYVARYAHGTTSDICEHIDWAFSLGDSRRVFLASASASSLDTSE